MKKSAKILIGGLFAAAACSSVQAQGVIISTDVTDVNLAGLSHSDIAGSPYLYDSWEIGSVQLKDGTRHNNLLLKYDQIHDEIIFFNKELNKMQVFAQPVHEFVIKKKFPNGLFLEKLYRNGFTGTDNVFYEVLVDGKTKLLKRTYKTVVEERADNSLLKTKQIKEVTNYFLSTSNDVKKIKKNKKDFVLLFPDRQKDLEDYVNKNQVDVKTEEGMIDLVAFYNGQ